MYCVVCGSKVDQLMRYCPVCGAEIPYVQDDSMEGMETTSIQMNQQIPAEEVQTARVRVTDETDRLVVDDNGYSKTSTEKRKDDSKAVKIRPKKLWLKITLVVVLLFGVGLGVFFGVRLLKGKVKASAYYKKFTKEQVAKTTDNADYVCGQILLKAKQDVPASRVKSLVEEKRGTIVGEIPVTNDYQIEFENPMTVKEQDLKTIIEEWKQRDKIVASAQLHYAYGTEGGFKYTDNPWKDDMDENAAYGDKMTWDIYHPAGNNWAVESIWTPLVWDSLGETTYQQVDIGIVDTVFDTTHMDLTGRFAPVKDGLSDDEWTNDTESLVEGNPVDAYGYPTIKDDYKQYEGTYDQKKTDQDEKRLMHGTHVSGIIAANMDDDFGITGVAQNAILYAYAMSGSYTSVDKKSYSSQFEWKYVLSKMMENDIRLINVSMQIDSVDRTEESMKIVNDDMDMFFQACIERGYDFLLVKSAGDDNLQSLDDSFLSGIETESVRNRIFVVGGAKCDYDEYEQLRGYKKTKSTNYGVRIDIYAPGANVLSDIPGDRTEKRNGTSGSAAFVTGACALVMGILPDCSMIKVKEIIQNNCYYTVEVTIQDNEQDMDVERGYLNVYMATEAAKALQTGESEAGGAEGKALVDGEPIREWMEEKIKNNSIPTQGILDLSLDSKTVEGILDIGTVRCIATKGKSKKEFKFRKDGSLRETLNPGKWKISIECEGYDPVEIEVELKAGEESKENNIVLVRSLDWRQAYLDYVKEKELLVLRAWDGYLVCPDKVLLKDLDCDGIPEFCYGYHYATSMEVGGYTVSCLSIRNAKVEEIPLGYGDYGTPLMKEGKKLDLFEKISLVYEDGEGNQRIHSDHEDEIYNYILTGDYSSADESEKEIFKIVGKHVILSDDFGSLKIGYYDGVVYLALTIVTSDVSDPEYYGCAIWDGNGKVTIHANDFGYDASCLECNMEVVDGIIHLSDVVTYVIGPDDIVYETQKWGDITTLGLADIVEASYSDWQKGYLDFINENPFAEKGLSFYVPRDWDLDPFIYSGMDSFIGACPVYINDDDIPELIFQWGEDRITIIVTWNDVEKRVDYVEFDDPYDHGFLQIDTDKNVIWYATGRQGYYRDEVYMVNEGNIEAVGAGDYHWNDFRDMGSGDDPDYSKAVITWSSDGEDGPVEKTCSKNQYDQYLKELGCGEYDSKKQYGDYINEGHGYPSVGQLTKWIENH